MTKKEIGKFIKDCYKDKHPVIWHLRINQGFHIDEVVSILEQFQSNTISMTREEERLIEDAVNAYLHVAVEQLGRKDLGDIERKNWEGTKRKCEAYFKRRPL